MAIHSGSEFIEEVDMPEFKYAKGRVFETMQFIAAEMKEFDEEYANKSRLDYQNDRRLQKLIDRTVENILTALIELCGTILTEKGIVIEGYAQVLSECARLFGLTEEEQDSLGKLAIQRNRIAHRYLNFRWEAVCMFNRTRPIISKLITKILEKEGK